MSLFSLPWRNALILSLLAAALTFGIRFVHGEAAKAVAFVFTDIDNRAIRRLSQIGTKRYRQPESR